MDQPVHKEFLGYRVYWLSIIDKIEIALLDDDQEWKIFLLEPPDARDLASAILEACGRR